MVALLSFPCNNRNWMLPQLMTNLVKQQIKFNSFSGIWYWQFDDNYDNIRSQNMLNKPQNRKQIQFPLHQQANYVLMSFDDLMIIMTAFGTQNMLNRQYLRRRQFAIDGSCGFKDDTALSRFGRNRRRTISLRQPYRHLTVN